jgi:hypothetical protein
MKILLDLNAKLGRDHVFKPTIGNDSSHEVGNVNGARVVNFTTLKKSVMSTMFPHCSIHKYRWSSDGKTQLD